MDLPASAKPRSGLSPEQKAAFVLLLFLGLAGVVLGFRSFGANLRRPFEEQLARAGRYVSPEEEEAQELAAQKTRDTDADGLTDYDELYVYKTSAYLQDSDSDGFDDKTEIFSGNDPNCPQGKTCGGLVVNPETTTETAAPAGSTGAEAALLPANTPTFKTEQDLVDFLLALPTDQIRAYLKQSGVPEGQLAKLSDDQLKQAFKDAVDTALKQGDFKNTIEETTVTP